MISIGVIADTHVPDITKQISPQIKEIFTNKKVEMIIHAGDICTSALLDELEEIAPVTVVRGNRDILIDSKIPLVRRFNLEEVKVVLTHGHFGLRTYIKEKASYYFRGPRKFEYLEKELTKKFPEADLIIYGHHHVPNNKYINGQLLFNPGSPTRPNEIYQNLKPSVGLIHIDGKEIKSEIVYLD